MKKILFIIIILGLVLSACAPDGGKFQVTCYQQGIKISDGVYKRGAGGYWYDLDNKLVYFPSDGCMYVQK